MNTTTFHSSATDHASSHLHAVGEFPVAWFHATPAYIALRPVAAFVTAWFHATPIAIALRTLFR